MNYSLSFKIAYQKYVPGLSPPKKILITAPVTVLVAERSFSKLDIRYNLTFTKTTLCCFQLYPYESKVAKAINCDDLINFQRG